MKTEINLKIKFMRVLSEQEQMVFWNMLIDEMERLSLKAGGGHDATSLDWMIDYSEAFIDKEEIINQINNFLQIHQHIIADYRIE